MLGLVLAPLPALASIFVPTDLVTYDVHAEFAPPVGGISDVHLPDWPVVDPFADIGFRYYQDLSLFPEGLDPDFIRGINPEVYVEVDLSPSAGAGDFLIGLTVTETAGEVTTRIDIQVADTPIPGPPDVVPAECPPGTIDLGAGLCFFEDPALEDPFDPGICIDGSSSPCGYPVPAECPSGGIAVGPDFCEVPGVEVCPGLGTAPACYHLEPSTLTVPVPAAPLVDLDMIISDLDWGVPGFITDVVAGVNELGCSDSFANSASGSSVSLSNCFGAGLASFEVFVSHARIPDPEGVPVPPVLILMGVGLVGLGFVRRKTVKK